MENQIIPCLWFDNQAEEAARFYTSVFKDSKIENISRYGKEGFEIHHQKEGTVLTVTFQINGQSFVALNGGPVFKFNESVSFQVFCQNQEEIIIGISCQRMARKGSAAGLRTNSDFPGKSFRKYYRSY